MIGGLTWSALIGAAAVDSINPCTLAVLLILLTTLVASEKNRKALWAGIAFTTAIFISYFLMGLGFFTALQASGLTNAFYYIVIVIALVVGVLSIRAYFKYQPGMASIEMPKAIRPYAKKFIRGVTSIPGAFVIGLLCSLFLLPCSSGPYLVILGLLAQTSTRIAAIPLLAIYNLIFVLPMVIITLFVYIGMTSVERVRIWKEKYVKVVHLISGIIMTLLAILLFIALQMGWL